MLGAWWIFNTLRNQIGEGVQDAPGIHDDLRALDEDIEIGPRDDAFRPAAPDLPLCDWLPNHTKSAAKGFAAVHRIFDCFISNELGRRDSPELNKIDHASSDNKSAVKRLDIAANKMQHGLHFSVDEYYTSAGGPQWYIPPRGLKPIAFNHKRWKQDTPPRTIEFHKDTPFAGALWPRIGGLTAEGPLKPPTVLRMQERFHFPPVVLPKTQARTEKRQRTNGPPRTLNLPLLPCLEPPVFQRAYFPPVSAAEHDLPPRPADTTLRPPE